MKLLITHELFAPGFAGGGEYTVYETAKNLIRRGMEVTVLTTGDPSITCYEDIPTIRLPHHRYRMNLAVPQILRHARDVDMIQTFNYHACLPSFLAARLLHKPAVCYVLALFGEVWKQIKPGPAGHAWMAWERFLVTRGYDWTIFPSDFSLKQGIDLGASPARSSFINPGIDLTKYRAAEEKEDVVLFVGKMEVRKGIDDLISVARILPHVRFRIFGWGDDRARIEKTAPGNVEVLPFERGQKLQKEFGRARIFFFPSKAETFGLVIAEAMASGCAVVSTITLDYQGARVKTGDISGMARVLDELWRDRERTAQMGMKNIELAQYYNWDRYTDELVGIYNRVLHSHKKRKGVSCH